MLLQDLTVEIHREQVACIKDQLPGAGLAMETLTIEGGAAIEL